MRGKLNRKAATEAKTGGVPFSFSGALLFSIAFVLIALLIEAGFNALIPLSVRFFIDRALPAPSHTPFYLMVGVLAVGAAVAVSTGLLRDFLSARVQSRSLGGLRQSMFEQLQRLSLQALVPPFHPQSRTSELLDGFSSDFASIENTVAFAIPWGVLPVLEAILSTGLMLSLDWRAGLAGFLLWPWIILAPRTVTARVTRASEACRDHEKHMLGALRENLSAQAIIRAFSLEKMGLTVFRKRNDVLSRSMMRAGLLSAFTERFTGAGILCIQTFLLVLSTWLAYEKQITVGTLVALQMLAVTLSTSLLFIIEYLPSISIASAAWRRIQEIVDAPQAVGNRPDARTYLPCRPRSSFPT